MKLVLFTMGLQEYGVDIEQVGEVIRLEQTVPIPDVPSWVEGLISVHGVVMPVINLRKRLNISVSEIDVANRVMIVHRDERVFGVIVDSVLGVVNIDMRDITNRDEIANQTPYINGVARVTDGLIPIMDLYSMLNDTDIDRIQRTHNTPLTHNPVLFEPTTDKTGSETTRMSTQSMEAQ